MSVSGRAVVFATVLGVSAGLLITVGRFPGRRVCIALLSSFMALPTLIATHNSGQAEGGGSAVLRLRGGRLQ